ncbi:hypothetical protein SAMN05443573_102378 [Celeribacter indicus]|nr:hypothetical protein SAMN05443573_102378 [Celeribacter indicus]
MVSADPRQAGNREKRTGGRKNFCARFRPADWGSRTGEMVGDERLELPTSSVQATLNSPHRSDIKLKPFPTPRREHGGHRKQSGKVGRPHANRGSTSKMLRTYLHKILALQVQVVYINTHGNGQPRDHQAASFRRFRKGLTEGVTCETEEGHPDSDRSTPQAGFAERHGPPNRKGCGLDRMIRPRPPRGDRLNEGKAKCNVLLGDCPSRRRKRIRRDLPGSGRVLCRL